MFSSPILEKGSRLPSPVLGKGSIGSQVQYRVKVMFSSPIHEKGSRFSSPVLGKGSIGSPVQYCKKVL